MFLIRVILWAVAFWLNRSVRSDNNHNADHAGCARSKRCCAQPGNAQHRTPRRCASQGTGNPWGLESYRDRFFGNLLRSFSRFGLQDAQTPPSPLVGEGGWGDEGQRRSLSRAFINERSGAFRQRGYDLDPAPQQFRLSVASPQSCTVANRK